jgi:hypothetical protein
MGTMRKGYLQCGLEAQFSQHRHIYLCNRDFVCAILNHGKLYRICCPCARCGSDKETVHFELQADGLIILPSTAYNDAQERAQGQDGYYGDCDPFIQTKTNDEEKKARAIGIR